MIKRKTLKTYKPIDVNSCRSKKNYTYREYLLRFIWNLLNPFFSLSPRKCFFWRNFMLRVFGAKIGKNVHIYPSVKIFIPWNLSIGDYSSIGDWAIIYNLAEVVLENSVTISHKAHICTGTHIYEDKDLPLVKKKIIIHDFAWICTEAFVSPGCNIGEGSVIGACSVVLNDIPEWEVVGGNPARFIKKRKMQNDN